MDDSNENILLFDGVCNLCNGLVRFIIKRDAIGKFKFASLQSEIGQQYLRQFGLKNEFQSLVLIQGDQCYIKSTGALKILREVGGIWRIFGVLFFIPRPIRDFFYDQIAKSRYKVFGKRDACMIPTPELKGRFL